MPWISSSSSTESEPQRPTADFGDDRVKMPSPGWRRPSSAQIGGDQRTELDHPHPYRLIADLNPALRQHLLQFTKAQRESQIEPHRPADHRRGEPMTFCTKSPMRPPSVKNLLYINVKMCSHTHHSAQITSLSAPASTVRSMRAFVFVTEGWAPRGRRRCTGRSSK